MRAVLPLLYYLSANIPPSSHNPNDSQAQQPASGFNLNLQQPGPTGSGAKIDAEHLRPTTKYDNIIDLLAKRIETADKYILDQITVCNQVSDLLPVIAATGNNVPNDVAFVSSKLEQLENGLENDAADIEALRATSKKDIANGRVIFRGIDRLKMPLQYQQAANGDVGSAYATGGGGWWNHPQTLQRAVRTHGTSRTMQVPSEDDQDEVTGPTNLVDFFNTRTDEMADVLEGYKVTLAEIEKHLRWRCSRPGSWALLERWRMLRGRSRTSLRMVSVVMPSRLGHLSWEHIGIDSGCDTAPGQWCTFGEDVHDDDTLVA